MGAVKKKTKKSSPRKESRTLTRKTRTQAKKPLAKHIKKKPVSARPSLRKTHEDTYVFECTRAGCGYRIWHDAKHEPGQLRFDMKCPKCHNHVFKCLGKGDIPETFEVPAATEVLDLNNISSTELGSTGS